MNVYDQAHILARAMRDSEEFKEYERLREPAYADSTNKALLDEYKRCSTACRPRWPPVRP